MSELPIFSSVEAEEQAGQLRSFLKELGADISEKSQGLDQDAFDLVKACPILATLESETEVEMVLNSLMSLILILPKNSVEKVVKDFCSTLTADDSAFAPVKFGGPVIRVLSNLFHGFGGIGTEADERRHLQFDIYCTMLKVAARSNLVRQVPTDLTTVKQWMTDWKLDTEQRRYCLRLLHTMLVKGQQSELGNKVMLELLATYTVDDAASAEADATACIRTAISDPGQFIFDHLLSLSPVKQLSGSKIHHLLNIFVTGVLQDYLKFYSENKDFVENLPLNMRLANMFKMRVLTLLTIGDDCPEIGLAEVATKLQLELSEDNEALEEFIIGAVQTKMIKAKIDEMAGKLIISSTRHRTFGRPQWEQLQCRLAQWTASLRGVKGQLSQLMPPVTAAK